MVVNNSATADKAASFQHQFYGQIDKQTYREYRVSSQHLAVLTDEKSASGKLALGLKKVMDGHNDRIVELENEIRHHRQAKQAWNQMRKPDNAKTGKLLAQILESSPEVIKAFEMENFGPNCSWSEPIKAKNAKELKSQLAIVRTLEETKVDNAVKPEKKSNKKDTTSSSHSLSTATTSSTPSLSDTSTPSLSGNGSQDSKKGIDNMKSPLPVVKKLDKAKVKNETKQEKKKNKKDTTPSTPVSSTTSSTSLSIDTSTPSLSTPKQILSENGVKTTKNGTDEMKSPLAVVKKLEEAKVNNEIKPEKNSNSKTTTLASSSFTISTTPLAIDTSTPSLSTPSQVSSGNGTQTTEKKVMNYAQIVTSKLNLAKVKKPEEQLSPDGTKLQEEEKEILSTDDSEWQTQKAARKASMKNQRTEKKAMTNGTSAETTAKVASSAATPPKENFTWPTQKATKRTTPAIQFTKRKSITNDTPAETVAKVTSVSTVATLTTADSSLQTQNSIKKTAPTNGTHTGTYAAVASAHKSEKLNGSLPTATSLITEESAWPTPKATRKAITTNQSTEKKVTTNTSTPSVETAANVASMPTVAPLPTEDSTLQTQKETKETTSTNPQTEKQGETNDTPAEKIAEAASAQIFEELSLNLTTAVTDEKEHFKNAEKEIRTASIPDNKEKPSESDNDSGSEEPGRSSRTTSTQSLSTGKTSSGQATPASQNVAKHRNKNKKKGKKGKKGKPAIKVTPEEIEAIRKKKKEEVDFAYEKKMNEYKVKSQKAENSDKVKGFRRCAQTALEIMEEGNNQVLPVELREFNRMVTAFSTSATIEEKCDLRKQYLDTRIEELMRDINATELAVRMEQLTAFVNILDRSSRVQNYLMFLTTIQSKVVDFTEFEKRMRFVFKNGKEEKQEIPEQFEEVDASWKKFYSEIIPVLPESEVFTHTVDFVEERLRMYNKRKSNQEDDKLTADYRGIYSILQAWESVTTTFAFLQYHRKLDRYEFMEAWVLESRRPPELDEKKKNKSNIQHV